MADGTFAHYFQTELAYYRELAQEYAKAYPEVAHLVSGRGGDRAVERLFQGAALLTARLRQRADDDFPEVVHPLFERLWPQYLRPLPAATVLRFNPIPDVLTRSEQLPRGTIVKSRPAGPSAVESWFQTSFEIALHPLQLSAVDVLRAHPADLQLRLRFEITGGATFDDLGLRSLRLQALGDELTRFTLYLWMASCTDRVTVRDIKGEIYQTLPRKAIVPVGLEVEESLFPMLPTPLRGLALLQEYFVLPDKFLGVEVHGLDTIPLGALQGSFDLVFHLGRPPEAGLHVSANNLALGCVPGVNLSEAERVPVAIEPGVHQFRLQAPGSGLVFEVHGVGGHDPRKGEWVEYRPFFAERTGSPDDKQPCYQVLRQMDGVEGIQTYIKITDGDGRPLPVNTSRLNVRLSYTNGDLPLALDEDQVDQPTGATPAFVTFSNVTRVVAGEPIRLSIERLWELLAQFSMHPRDLLSLNGLLRLLREARGGRTARSEPDLKQISTTVLGRLHGQTVVPMRQVEVTLGDDGFGCEGERFLFATILDRVLSPALGSNLFNRLTVKGTGDSEDQVYRFEPRHA